MINLHRFFVSLLLTGLSAVYAPITQAEPMQQGYGSTQQQTINTGQLQHYTNSPNPSYGSEIGAKALSGFANMLAGPLEIPKNVINTSNQSNVFYGIFGGGFKGIVHTAGRLAVGLTELTSLPLLTKPIAQPLYVWDNFDVETSYGSAYSLQEPQDIEQPVVQAPPPPPAVAQPEPQPVEYPAPDSRETNKQLDTLFKKEMMK